MNSQRRTEKSDLLTKRKSLFNKKINGNPEVEQLRPDNGKFTDILHKKWKIFRVSPIYNFSRNKLKLYEKKLDEEINSKKRVTSKVGYKSHLTLNKNLKLNDECAEALQVEIIKDDSQSIYVGHFMSWSNTKVDVSDSVCLPILLVEGKAHEINGVHSCLSKIFDCDIQPVAFSFYALITFFVKLLEIPRSDIDVTQEEVTLEYKVPGCEANDKVKISFVLQATIIVLAVTMESLQNKYQGITPMEIILEFYNKILNHAYHIFKMDLMLTELHKITFPDAFLTKDGQLKMSTHDAAVSALEVLQHFTPLDALNCCLENRCCKF